MLCWTPTLHLEKVQFRVFTAKNITSCKVFLPTKEQGQISISLTASLFFFFANINMDFCIYSTSPLGNRVGTECKGSILHLLKVNDWHDSVQLTAFLSPKLPCFQEG